MHQSALTAATRQTALTALRDGGPLEVLVIGGGVTGAGIALDAATRGLRTGVIEMQDWAQGTSSRSSKLVHGGLRYLYNLDFALVAEALRERGLLLDSLAPHLVRAQPFLWPLQFPVIERAYSAVGVGLYDMLSVLGSKGRSVPGQKHYSRAGALRLFPDIRPDQLVGGIRFFDARVDDARLVLALVRTAAQYGAYAASRTQAVDFTRDANGRVNGIVAADLETGERFPVRAERVVLATGVWTEDAEALAHARPALRVMTTKGIHLVVPKERIRGETGLFLRTEKSVLFIIPWDRYWVIGTTDTAWHEELRHPVATSADIDYVLEHANQVLSCRLTRDDVIGTYAGLRPLVRPERADEQGSAKVSREHTVAEVAPGLTAIAGGKLTTYRVMAEDAVDFALGEELSRRLPSATDRTPLVGASGLTAAARGLARRAGAYGWSEERVQHLLGRYGAEVNDLLALIDAHPAWGEPLAAAPAFLRVEAAAAVLWEGALHLEDVLNHRLRLALELPDRGAEAAAEIAAIIAPLLGWDDAVSAREVDGYREQAAAEIAAQHEGSDAGAVRVRLEAPELFAPVDAEPSEAEPSEAEPNEAGPSEAEPNEAGPSEARPTEAGTPGDRSG